MLLVNCTYGYFVNGNLRYINLNKILEKSMDQILGHIDFLKSSYSKFYSLFLQIPVSLLFLSAQLDYISQGPFWRGFPCD